MPDVRRVERRGGQPADGDRDAPAGQLVEKRGGRVDFCSGRSAVRRLAAGMRRHDVPEEYVFLDSEPREHAVDDGGRRLRGTGARELALGRERNPAYPRAAVAGGFADEDDLRSRSQLEV